VAKTVAGISASKRIHFQTAKAARKGRLSFVVEEFAVEDDDNCATHEFERLLRESAIDLKVTKFVDRLSGIHFQKNPDRTSQSEQY
jgi:hypothetical protein